MGALKTKLKSQMNGNESQLLFQQLLAVLLVCRLLRLQPLAAGLEAVISDASTQIWNSIWCRPRDDAPDADVRARRAFISPLNCRCERADSDSRC